MLAQRARLLSFYAGLVYNSWKHKITTEKPNMSKNSSMNFFINSGEKNPPSPKNFPSFYNKKACFFYRPKEKGSHNVRKKVKEKEDPLFSQTKS